MPIYEYECSACGERSEYLQKVSEAPRSDCELCGRPGTLTKLISSPAIQFKGDGWYLTDYSDKEKKKKASARKEDSSSTSVSSSATDSSSTEKKETAQSASDA